MEEADKRLVAFSDAVYFAGLRPESTSRKGLTLSEGYWGNIHLKKAAPELRSSGWIAARRKKNGARNTVRRPLAGQSRVVPS
jgi:hypothetical protein